MVKLLIKRGDEVQFLIETTCSAHLSDLIVQLVKLHNARLQVERLCDEIKQLASHGVTMAPNMQGLTDEQIDELRLVDEWAARCEPSGGHVNVKDPVGRRCGKAPNEKMAAVLNKTADEAKSSVSRKQAEANVCLTEEMVQDALDKLRGAAMIVYPMGLPPHDPIRMEFEGKVEEATAGLQASLAILDEVSTQLWWAGKDLQRDKTLAEYIGKNEKTKIIAKLQKKGHGPPAREPVVSEEEKKQMMAYAYKRQEELKKLGESSDDSHLNSPWADPHMLQRQFQGMGQVSWRPK